MSTKYLGINDWQDLVDRAIEVEDLEQTVTKGSFPSLAFFFMLLCSTAIATFGLLANSAAVVIGAMIVAPLMNPIISTSYGLVAGRKALALRSLVTVVLGTFATVAFSILITKLIGWNIGGSEIAARTKPNLLDLGVAVAAGAAAAFAFTRPNVSSALAGIAIAVALVPPLCTVGIAIALGEGASSEVGVSLDELSPRGPFLLFLTNIVGIVLAAGGVFYWQYFRRSVMALVALGITLCSLVFVIPPLGVSMDNLLIRNKVRRSLAVETKALLPEEESIRFDNLSVLIVDSETIVTCDIIAVPDLITQDLVNNLRDRLSELVKTPVTLKIGIITVPYLRSTE